MKERIWSLVRWDRVLIWTSGKLILLGAYSVMVVLFLVNPLCY